MSQDRHRSPGRWAELALVLSVWSLLASCQLKPTPRSEVVVLVDASPALASAIDNVKIEVHDRAGSRLVDQTAFSIRADGAGAERAAAFPFSFGVRHNDANEFLVLVSAYADAAQTELLIETKAIAAFVPGQTRLLPLILAEVCRAQRACSDLRATCYPEAIETTAAGECGPVRVQPTRPLAADAGISFEWPKEILDGPGSPPASGQQDGSMPLEVDDAGMDAAPSRPRDASADSALDAAFAPSVDAAPTPVSDAAPTQSTDAAADATADAADAAPMPPKPPARSGYLIYIGSNAGGPRELFGIRIQDGKLQGTPVKLSEPFAQGFVHSVSWRAGVPWLLYSFAPATQGGDTSPTVLYFVDLSRGLPGTRVTVLPAQTGVRTVWMGAPSGDARYLSYGISRVSAGAGGDCQDLYVAPVSAGSPQSARRINTGGAMTSPMSYESTWIGNRLYYREASNCLDPAQSVSTAFVYDATTPERAAVRIVEDNMYTSMWYALAQDGNTLTYTAGDATSTAVHRTTLSGTSVTSHKVLPGSDTKAEAILDPAPNGSRIIFTAAARGPQREVFLLDDASPTGAIRVSPDLQSSTDQVYHGRWSPNSAKYVFEQIMVDATSTIVGTQLRVVDVARGTPYQSFAAVSVFDVRNHSWSPDGTMLFFNSRDSSTSEISSKRAVRLTSTGAEPVATLVQGLPANAKIAGITFSSDGGTVVYAVSYEEKTELYAAPWPSVSQTARALSRRTLQKGDALSAMTFVAGAEFVVAYMQSTSTKRLLLLATDGSSAQDITTLTDYGGVYWLPDSQ